MDEKMEIINKLNIFPAAKKEDELRKIILKHDFEGIINFIEKHPEACMYKMNIKINDISYKLTPLDCLLVNINQGKYPHNDLAVINLYKYLIENTDFSYAYQHNYHHQDNTFHRITDTLNYTPFYLSYLIENRPEALDYDPSVLIKSHYKLIDWMIQNPDIMFLLLNKKPEAFNHTDLKNRTIYSEVINNLNLFKKEELALIFSHADQKIVDEAYYKNDFSTRAFLIPDLLKSLSEDKDADKITLILDTLFSRSELSLNLDFINKEDLEYYYRMKANAEKEDISEIYTPEETKENKQKRRM